MADKTQVMVYFSLYGDEFPTKKVTERLKINPTNTYIKGELISNRSSVCYRKETNWEIGTGYQDSIDVNEQLNQIAGKIQDKVSEIIDIKKEFAIDCKFFIVIKIEEGLAPSLYLNKNIIKLAASMEAEFDFDLYSNPYESEM